MKNLTLAAVFLASITGIMSLPAGNNAGINAQYLPWFFSQNNPQLAAWIQALNQNWQAQAAPTTYVSASAPAGGVNVGGGTGGNPGTIYASPPAGGVNIGEGTGGRPGTIITTTPATGAGGVVNVPAGASVTVTGGNGSAGGVGAPNQGNGGSITVTGGNGSVGGVGAPNQGNGGSINVSAGNGSAGTSTTTDSTSGTDASASSLF